MFGKVFLLVVGVFGIYAGFSSGDYLWGIAGVCMTLGGLHFFYQMKTGRSVFEHKFFNKNSK